MLLEASLKVCEGAVDRPETRNAEIDTAGEKQQIMKKEKQRRIAFGSWKSNIFWYTSIGVNYEGNIHAIMQAYENGSIVEVNWISFGV